MMTANTTPKKTHIGINSLVGVGLGSLSLVLIAVLALDMIPAFPLTRSVILFSCVSFLTFGLALIALLKSHLQIKRSPLESVSRADRVLAYLGFFFGLIGSMCGLVLVVFSIWFLISLITRG
jgi:hypothetical protein